MLFMADTFEIYIKKELEENLNKVGIDGILLGKTYDNKIVIDRIIIPKSIKVFLFCDFLKNIYKQYIITKEWLMSNKEIAYLGEIHQCRLDSIKNGKKLSDLFYTAKRNNLNYPLILITINEDKDIIMEAFHKGKMIEVKKYEYTAS